MAGGAIGGIGGVGAGLGLGASIGGAHAASPMTSAPHNHVHPVQATPRLRSVDDLSILYLLLTANQNQQNQSNPLMSLAVQPASSVTGGKIDLMV